jgi:hypothetical protein
VSAKNRPSARKRCGTAGNRGCTGIEKGYVLTWLSSTQ